MPTSLSLRTRFFRPRYPGELAYVPGRGGAFTRYEETATGLERLPSRRHDLLSFPFLLRTPNTAATTITAIATATASAALAVTKQIIVVIVVVVIVVVVVVPIRVALIGGIPQLLVGVRQARQDPRVAQGFRSGRSLFSRLKIYTRI